MIPQTFHRIWFGPPMPEEFRRYGEEWARLNPGWSVREWREEDLDWLENRELFERAPEIVPPRLVHRMRSNLARYEILWRYGGVYLDVDLQPLTPIESHITDLRCFAALQGGTPGLIGNSILGAEERHHFMWALIEQASQSVAERPGQPSWRQTGPEHVTRVHAEVPGLTLLPKELFYPHHPTDDEAPDLSGAVCHHVWASRRRQVSVIVPWRDTGDAYRRRAWEWVKARFIEQYPSWQIIEAADDDDDPLWSKAVAIRNGLREMLGDVVVIHDADVWCDELERAVIDVQERRGWAVPHRQVRRLTKKSTKQVVYSAPLDDELEVEEVYTGVVGGGIMVLDRSVLERVPPDPRFRGWGQQDVSHGIALTKLAGRPRRGSGRLWHLWHPPQERQNRNVGSTENHLLFRRYVAAQQSTTRMARIVNEHRGGVGSSGVLGETRRWKHIRGGWVKVTTAGSAHDKHYEESPDWFEG